MGFWNKCSTHAPGAMVPNLILDFGVIGPLNGANTAYILKNLRENKLVELLEI